MTVTFVHCKWSHEDTVGRRLEDLYELLGQAVRTVRWTGSGVIWTELSRRLASRASTKVIVGDPRQIAEAASEYGASPPGISFKVICVQPGIDTSRINTWSSGKPLICATKEWLTANDVDMVLVGGHKR